MDIQSDNLLDPITASKLLSICIPARDDGYFLDFMYRIATTINHLAASIKNLGLLDRVEILITDWGSPIPISRTIELSQEAAEITRFIYVKPEIIRGVMKNGNDAWHLAIPPNVAVRRASGRFILTYPADTLISQYSFETLFRFLNGEIQMSIDLERSYFLIPRYHAPWQFLERQPNLEEWNRYFEVCSKNTPLEQSACFCYFGDAGGFLMHHSLWYKFRGFDEPNYEYSPNDIELGFRVTQYYPHFSLSNIGVFLYHMGHPPNKGNRVFKQKNVNVAPVVYNTSVYVNDENWGLGNVDLSLQPVPAINYITANDITKDVLVKKKYSETLKLTIEDFNIQIQDDIIFQNIKRALSFVKGHKFNIGDLNALCLLAWYGNFNYPRRYVEFFAGRTPATGIVAVACPSVEIFKIDLLEGVAKPNNPFNISNIYNISPYCGYLRLINGDVNTAVNRLIGSFIGSFTFDLGYIKEETIGEDFEKHLHSLLPYLAPGGALVFNSSSTVSFTSLLKKLQISFPNFTLFSCADIKTGMIFADSIIKDSNKTTRIEGITFDKSWVQSFLLYKKIMFFLVPIIIPPLRWMKRKLLAH